jgi:hypothetical protein
VLQHLESGVFSDVRRTARRGVSKVRRLQWKYALELYGLVPRVNGHRYQDAKDASAKAHAGHLGRRRTRKANEG